MPAAPCLHPQASRIYSALRLLAQQSIALFIRVSHLCGGQESYHTDTLAGQRTAQLCRLCGRAVRRVRQPAHAGDRLQHHCVPPAAAGLQRRPHPLQVLLKLASLALAEPPKPIASWQLLLSLLMPAEWHGQHGPACQVQLCICSNHAVASPKAAAECRFANLAITAANASLFHNWTYAPCTIDPLAEIKVDPRLPCAEHTTSNDCLLAPVHHRPGIAQANQSCSMLCTCMRMLPQNRCLAAGQHHKPRRRLQHH